MTKSNPQVTIVNCTTGEEIVRDATGEEIAQIEIDKVNAATVKAESIVKATAKADLLAKLGITAEEATLLLS